MCPRCFQVIETANQAIFSCEELSLLWFQSHLALRTNSPQLVNFEHWLQDFIINQQIEATEMLAMIAHEIWLDRNKLCFERRKLEPHLIIAHAISVLNAYQNGNTLQAAEPKRSTSIVDAMQRWKAPGERMFKINTDVAEEGEFRWGAGVVIHDHKGEVYAATMWHLSCDTETRLAVALRLKLGLKLARDMSFTKIIIESDYKDFHTVVLECISISNSFLSCSFSHTRRGGRG